MGIKWVRHADEGTLPAQVFYRCRWRKSRWNLGCQKSRKQLPLCGHDFLSHDHSTRIYGLRFHGAPNGVVIRYHHAIDALADTAVNELAGR